MFYIAKVISGDFLNTSIYNNDDRVYFKENPNNNDSLFPVLIVLITIGIILFNKQEKNKNIKKEECDKFLVFPNNQRQYNQNPKIQKNNNEKEQCNENINPHPSINVIDVRVRDFLLSIGVEEIWVPNYLTEEEKNLFKTLNQLINKNNKDEIVEIINGRKILTIKEKNFFQKLIDPIYPHTKVNIFTNLNLLGFDDSDNIVQTISDNYQLIKNIISKFNDVNINRNSKSKKIINNINNIILLYEKNNSK